ncbi:MULTISPECIES: hypothetical protein [unclassified Sinorhizobium]|uniref:hypothetical protein n=1 Tax=unclassified Sinorhizobium TaxID=2613772 RepID=UPI0035250F69
MAKATIRPAILPLPLLLELPAVPFSGIKAKKIPIVQSKLIFERKKFSVQKIIKQFQ